MRRREKFVITAILLSLGLLGVQYVAIEWRWWAVAGFSLLSFLFSGWALSDDLQRHEWLTVVPFPALFAASVGFFTFFLHYQMYEQRAVNRRYVKPCRN